MLSTYDSCRCSLAFSVTFHFFFYIVLLFDNAMFDSSFLLFISSRSSIFNPNLTKFLHYSSVSNSFLLMVVFSVLFSLTSTLLFVCQYGLCFLINTFLLLLQFCDEMPVITIYNFVQNVALHSFSPLRIYVSKVYWIFSHLSVAEGHS